jgi:hypothetical protein
MYAWVTDKPENMELVLYCDADLAGDRNDAKSTSGIFLCLMGPNSFVPLSGISKKQTSVSKSTPEAEIVAIDHGICKEGIPALYIWEKILGRKLKIKLMEDNQAASRVVITGKNPSMRHMSRTQRIDISWLNERYSDGDFEFIDCPSEYQAADIFTKFFTDGKVWTRNLRLIGIFGKKVLINQGAKDACPATTVVTTVCRAALFIKRIRERLIPVKMTCISAGLQGGNCNQVVFDFCNKEGNKVNVQANAISDCKVIRITVNDEAQIDDETIAIMRSNQLNKALLFSDIPCVNGNNWNFIRQLTETER